MNEVKLNKYGVNAKIKAHILPDEEMRRIGFRGKYCEGTKHEKDCPCWYFAKNIIFQGKLKSLDIEFVVKIYKDGSDINIMILDMDFGQPYDYQMILSKNPSQEVSLIVNEQVENFMEYLQENGVLRGHVRGEYI